MSKTVSYNIVHTCGHRQKHKVYVNRDGEPNMDYIEVLRSDPCSECKKAEERKKNPPLSFEEKKKLAYSNALANAKTYGYPKLVGTEKQVQWAIILRDNVLTKVQKETETRRTYETEYLMHKWDIACRWLVEQTSAKFWIDNRNRQCIDFVSIGFLETNQSWVRKEEDEDDWDERDVIRQCERLNWNK